jgi:hypothetical protein
MVSQSVAALSRRQVMVHLGNRTVVFGPAALLPQALHFSPDDDNVLLPRVADISEGIEERIAQTLKVSDFTKIERAAEGQAFDMQAVHVDGRTVMIDITVKERDARQRDFESQLAWVRGMDQIASGALIEAWYFNIERLKLVIMSLDDKDQPTFTTLAPLDVWEKTDTGVFTRQRVVNRVDDWINRVDGLYAKVKDYLASHQGLTVETTRSAPMSEEMMQNFAVPDRELPILDILRGRDPVLSLVPRALFIVGGRGRIDVITTSGTRLLVDQGSEGQPDWRLISAESRRQSVAFDQPAFNALVSQL